MSQLNLPTNVKEVFLNNTNLSYFASTDGKIYSVNHRGTVHLLKPYQRKDGYCFVNILDNSRRKKNGQLHNRTIHVGRLVAAAWLADGNYGFENDTNHKDCNPSNNNLDNLEIITRKENLLHAKSFMKNKPTYVRQLPTGKFKVQVFDKYLGLYNTEAAASRAAKEWILQTEGELPLYGVFMS